MGVFIEIFSGGGLLNLASAVASRDSEGYFHLGAASWSWIVRCGNFVDRLFSGMAASVSPFSPWNWVGYDHYRRCKPSGAGALGSTRRDGRAAALVCLGVWLDFSWSDLRQKSDETTQTEEPLIVIEAWYTPQIPIAQGPAEYGGLPGLILEVSAGNTTLLCSEIVLNPKENITISAPEKGEYITKNEYTSNIRKKMVEMRNNRMGRRRSR